jgi:hypothetical protein
VPETLPSVVRPDDLRRILKCGSATAYKIARQIGQRRGRLIFITGDALAKWLSDETSTSTPATHELPPLPPKTGGSL